MFTNDTSDENKPLINPVQYSPGRLSLYSINRCEDQVIGFEFITKQYQSNPRCCGSAIVNLCVPIEVIQPIELQRAEFWATDDPCYKDWIVKKIAEPYIEIQRNNDDLVTGILVRFSNETCCYPLQMAYKLYAFQTVDNIECKYLLSSGLLLFR